MTKLDAKLKRIVKSAGTDCQIDWADIDAIRTEKRVFEPPPGCVTVKMLREKYTLGKGGAKHLAQKMIKSGKWESCRSGPNTYYRPITK